VTQSSTVPRTGAIAVVVRCGDRGRRLYATLRSVSRQTLFQPQGPALTDVAVVVDSTTDAATRAWVTAFCRERGFLLVESPQSSPAAVKNAGVRATTAPYVMCVGAGDLVGRDTCAEIVARLDADEGAAGATAAIQTIGPGALRGCHLPGPVALPAVLGSPELIPEVGVFRRVDWEAAGGFDEALSVLDGYDFWLHRLDAGRHVLCVNEAVVTQIAEPGSLQRRQWDEARHVDDLARVLRKHAGAFRRHAPELLAERERRLLALAPRFQALVARRDAIVEQLDAVRGRIDGVRQRYPTLPVEVTVGPGGRTSPVSAVWGFDRGTPVDRHYIEEFLQTCAGDIHGVVLEVQDATYVRRFGGSRVDRVDVVDVDSTNPAATIVSDLRCASNIPSGTYDCVLLTQVLHLVDDMGAMVSECARILKPGGVLLATMPCASRVATEYGPAHDHWRVTEAGARHLFGEVFDGCIRVRTYGNALAASAFLYGLASEEVAPALDAPDARMPLLVSVCARKPPAG